MGAFTESGMLNQLKKGQGETNERLDRIVAELQALSALMRQALAQPAGYADGGR